MSTRQFPVPRTMTKAEVENYLGRTTMEAVINCDKLKPCLIVNHKTFFFATAEVVAIEAARARGEFPGKPVSET